MNEKSDRIMRCQEVQASLTCLFYANFWFDFYDAGRRRRRLSPSNCGFTVVEDHPK